MIYRFDDYRLDTDALELTAPDGPVALEPQEFTLLLLLLENRERMVSRDEIIEKVWDGRVVSDSALSSRIKTLRRALGDDGTTQRVIRTVHGRGFRCIAEVTAAAPSATGMPGPNPAAAGKPSLAVLPFDLLGGGTPYDVLADAVPHELIAALSRLRWLFVIARGSSFRFRAPLPDVRELGRLLDVRYCLCGTLEIAPRTLAITVELADTRTAEVVWSDRHVCPHEGVHEVRERIVAQVVAALELRIPVNEAQAAQASAPQALDAWAAYHLGLSHMYRFNRRDNAQAGACFEHALTLAPGFARAHAGLSFTRFQDAFLHYTADAAAAALAARASAERGLELDPLDPFVNLVLGRSYWLEGDLGASLAWLDRATALSPNYAQGLYSRGWAETIAGRGAQGRAHVDQAMALSPLDPFLYAMKATRALSHLVDGDAEAAVRWADEAARTPGAHVLIAAIAVAANALAARHEGAEAWSTQVRERRPDLDGASFLRAFPFSDEALRRRIAAALAAHGFA